MRIDTVIKPKNPLGIAEIRALVATHLARRDLVICLRVSRDWFNSFVGPVWHTIDMVKDKKFVAINPQVLHTYGRCIREVFNILTFDHVKTLQHPKVDSVVTASITNLIKPLERLLEFDFIRRCNATLTELDFRGQAPQLNSYERDENFFDIGILSSCLTSSAGSSTVGTRLTSLTLTGMWLSHEGFNYLLRSSPTLRKLALFRVAIVHYIGGFDVFRGSSVTSLHASLAEICMPDPGSGRGISLLHQLSRLEEWHLTSVDRCKTWGSDPDFRRELRKCCPRLKTLRFDQVGNTDKLSDLLLDSFIEPESCTFSAKNLSNSMVLSLISHLDTLTTIIITDKCTDAAVIRWLYLIPKSCLRLKVLSMRDLVLDIESVKEHEWRCEELTELHVRFKGLEDAQLIDGCIKDVCNRRQLRERSLQDYISSQVSNHLLEFIMLTTVSLGSKVYSLSPFRE
ncbi:hypothetical protein EC957_009595 [Mortierella hygrophila]|uniref:F-box domain-containing protein n=1 Tax=Mortierella hygrophila TaxID=979708 RepID=A0A9P6EWV6_9FUNG|nr:hypothetical protein EC957_009595 [Mortierella hygrophila]